jgi:hypothetical protein
MITCLGGNVFIGSINTIEQNDAHYICNAFVGYIETIRVDNILQICINNVLSMKRATNLLIHHFPNIYFQGCGVHYMDLLLEDGGKVTWVKRIVNFFYKKIIHTIRPCGTSNFLSL